MGFCLALVKMEEGGKGLGADGISLVDGNGCGVVLFMNRGLGVE